MAATEGAAYAVSQSTAEKGHLTKDRPPSSENSIPTVACPDLDGKEVRGHHQLPVSAQKLFPGRLSAPIRRRLNPVLLQNIGNGPARDSVTEIRQRADYTSVAVVASSAVTWPGSMLNEMASIRKSPSRALRRSTISGSRAPVGTSDRVLLKRNRSHALDCTAILFGYHVRSALSGRSGHVPLGVHLFTVVAPSAHDAT